MIQLAATLLLSATAVLGTEESTPNINMPPQEMHSYFDTSLQMRVLRFLVGGDGDISSSSSIGAQWPYYSEGQIEAQFMLIMSTSDGGVYTMSPRSIDMTWNIFDTFEHSSVTSGDAQAATYPITDIKVDKKSSLVFVAVGDEIYAQKYYVRQAANSVPSEPINFTNQEGSNPNNREPVQYLTPVWNNPVRVYASNSSIPGVQSIAIDPINSILFAADGSGRQITKLDYSPLVQYNLGTPADVPTGPVVGEEPAQANDTIPQNDTAPQNDTTP